MIHKQQGEFSLLYDPSTDLAKLFCGELVIAESPRPDYWEVKHGPGWFAFEHQRWPRRRRFGGDLRGWLRHIRAMAGVAADVCSIAHRALNAAPTAPKG